MDAGALEFEPIKGERSVAVRIAEQILAAIRSGRFPVGERLPGEYELSRNFGVSRPTIREALGALQFAGYIDSVRGSGKRVIGLHPEPTYSTQRDLSVAEVLALLEARLITEPQVLALAASDPDIRALSAAESYIHGMSLAVHDQAIEAVTDLRVHAAMAKVCRNTFMVESSLRLLDLAGAPVLREARLRAWSDRSLITGWAQHHNEVLMAIKDRDEQAAADACRRHLRSATQNVLKALKEIAPREIDAISQYEERLKHAP